MLNNVSPTGGFQKFVDMRTDGDPATQGDETTLATWLDDAGYNTARVGKYLVGYPDGSTYVPPGWDEWYSTYDGFPSYFNYRMNENGTVVQYGSRRGGLHHRRADQQGGGLHRPGGGERRPAVLPALHPDRPARRARSRTARPPRPRGTPGCSPGRRPRGRRRSTRRT